MARLSERVDEERYTASTARVQLLRPVTIGPSGAFGQRSRWTRLPVPELMELITKCDDVAGLDAIERRLREKDLAAGPGSPALLTP